MIQCGYGWRPGPPFPWARGPVPNFFPSTFLQPVRTDRATFLRVAATSLSDLVSGYSEQVRACGVTPGPDAATPPFLPLLRVVRSIDDVVLEWEHVEHDVWGNPKGDVAHYRVLRNPAPDFHLDLAAFEDQVACPCAGLQSWTDTGAAALTGTRHVSFYLTPAVDAADEASGASRDLPRPPAQTFRQWWAKR